MARGKSFSVYLIDGSIDGTIKISNQNWSGLVYKIPRKQLDNYKDFDDFKRSGIYLLFGNGTVYVGQAEVRKNGKGILQRILDHQLDRLQDNWDQAIIFTDKEGMLGRTDISFLENKFYKKITEADNYIVKNSYEPTIGTVSLEKEDELETYFEMSEMVLGILGYRIFEKNSNKNNVPNDSYMAFETVLKLPQNNELKIGEYIRTVMRNLSQSGYVFSKKEIQDMCTSEWTKSHFGRKYPFMKQYFGGTVNTKGMDERVRFWSEVFKFGDYEVLISKEWFDYDFERFNKWYQTLGNNNK